MNAAATLAAVSSLSLVEVAEAVKAGQLSLVEAHALLGVRPAHAPNDWRPGDPVPPLEELACAPRWQCPTCGRPSGPLLRSGGST